MLATRRTGVQVDLEGTIHSDDPEDIVGKGDGVGLRGGGGRVSWQAVKNYDGAADTPAKDQRFPR